MDSEPLPDGCELATECLARLTMRGGRRGTYRAVLGQRDILLGEGITAYDFAEWMGTSPYEVLTSISARVPRVFVE